MAERFEEPPNIVFHVYKNRRGEHNNVKIWCRVDLGTCRTTDMFMTDNDYKLIPVEVTEVQTYTVDDENEKVDMETGEIISKSTENKLSDF